MGTSARRGSAARPKRPATPHRRCMKTPRPMGRQVLPARTEGPRPMTRTPTPNSQATARRGAPSPYRARTCRPRPPRESPPRRPTSPTHETSRPSTIARWAVPPVTPVILLAQHTEAEHDTGGGRPQAMPVAGNPTGCRRRQLPAGQSGRRPLAHHHGPLRDAPSCGVTGAASALAKYRQMGYPA